MAESAEKICLGVKAGGDLSSYQYRVIDIAGTLAETSAVGIGVLESKPRAAGQGARVGVFGYLKGHAGGTIAANAPLKVASGGFLVSVASGDNTVPCGKNTNNAVASGDIFSFYGNFINAGAIL